LEAVLFPTLYKEHADKIVTGACLLVKGSVSNRNGELSLSIENLKSI